MNKRLAPFIVSGLLISALVLGFLSYYPFGDRDASTPSPDGTRVTLVSPYSDREGGPQVSQNGDRESSSTGGAQVSQNGDRD